MCRRRQSSSAGGCGTGAEVPGSTAGCSPCAGVQWGTPEEPPGGWGPTPRLIFTPLKTSGSGSVPTGVLILSGHSPDLRWLCQGPRALLVSWCPTQAAGGARIHRHGEQAPVDTVTVHACEAHEKPQLPLSQEPRSPGPQAQCCPQWPPTTQAANPLGNKSAHFLLSPFLPEPGAHALRGGEGHPPGALRSWDGVPPAQRRCWEGWDGATQGSP